MRIREAVPADAQFIIQCQREMARETENVELDGDTVDKGVRAVFSDPRLGRYWIAVDDGGQPIGVLLITSEWSDWRNGVVWWIQSVYVVQGWRGKRVFSALYDFLRGRVVDDPSLRGLRLYVDRENTSAQEVYRKLGMNGDHYQLFEWMK